MRCRACVWLDWGLIPHKCIFALDYPSQVSLEEFKKRIMMVNPEQQSNLSRPLQRFVVDKSNLFK